MMKMTTGKLTELALLTASALILYVVELQLPVLVPIPGAKLGLANIVTVYAVYRYRPGEVLLVVLVVVSRQIVGSGSSPANSSLWLSEFPVNESNTILPLI